MSEEKLSRVSKETDTMSVKKTVKKGLSATQKTLAFVGSILGIITASISIMTFMHNNGAKKVPEKSVKTTIVKEVSNSSSSVMPSSSTVRHNTETSSSSTHQLSSSSSSMPSSSSTVMASSNEVKEGSSSSTISSSMTVSSSEPSVAGSEATVSE